jgi:HEAT repeat protein
MQPTPRLGWIMLAVCALGACREAPATPQAPTLVAAPAPSVAQVTWRENRYQLRADFLVEIGAAPKSTIVVEGELRISSTAPGQRRFQLAGASAVGHQAGIEIWRAEPARLEAPFYADYQPDGRLRASYIEADTPVQLRRVFETLVAQLQIVNSSGLPEWQADETDNVGTFLAGYQTQGPGKLSKRKLRYTGAGPNLQAVKGVAQIAKSDTHIELSEQAELLSMSSSDVVQLDTLQLRSGFELSLQRRSVWLEGSAAPPPSPSAKHVRYEIGHASVGSAREQDQALTNGFSLPKLIAALGAKPGAADRSELRQRLAALVRLDSAQAEQARLAVAQNQAIGEDLIGGLVLAGDAAAQQALVGIIADPSLEARLREHAAIFSAQVQTPAEPLLTALFKQFANDTSPIREVAGYASGTLLAKLGDTDTGRSVLNELTARLRTTDSSDERFLLLGMLGNAGARSAFASVQAFASAQSSRERAQATRALRGMDVPEAQVVVRKALTDESAMVRLAALESVEKLGPARFVDPLLAKARKDDNDRVRVKALGLLQGLRPAPKALERTVDWLSLHDRSAEVRAFADKVRQARLKTTEHRGEAAPQGSSKGKG